MTTIVTRGQAVHERRCRCRRTRGHRCAPESASLPARAASPRSACLLPGSRMLSRAATSSGIETRSPSTVTRSTGTTASALSGTTAPVEISIASPGPSSTRRGTTCRRPSHDREGAGGVRRADRVAVHRRAPKRRHVDRRPRRPRRLTRPAAAARPTRSAGSTWARARTRARASSTERRSFTALTLHQAHGVPSRRDLGRHSRAQRGAKRRPALRRARSDVRGRGARLGGGVRRRRLDATARIAALDPAARCTRQRPCRSLPPQLRQGGSARRGVQGGGGGDRRHDRR